jgi:hypothetical protein
VRLPPIGLISLQGRWASETTIEAVLSRDAQLLTPACLRPMNVDADTTDQGALPRQVGRRASPDRLVHRADGGPGYLDRILKGEKRGGSEGTHG